MQTLGNILFSLFFLVFPTISFGQVKPLMSGDTVTRESLVASQVGNDPIVFSSKGSSTYKLLIIDETGDKLFLKTDGSGFTQYANDKFFTDIIWNNRSIPTDRRFVRFPQGKQLQPGMKWDVPPRKIKTSCNEMVLNYTAVSEDGPEVMIAINGNPTKIKTIRINYEATLPTCNGQYTWRKTHEVLYSPELNELVGTKVINWSAYNPRLSLDSGDGWAVTAIQTADGVKTAEAQTAK
jgi:hypothetical protein